MTASLAKPLSSSDAAFIFAQSRERLSRCLRKHSLSIYSVLHFRFRTIQFLNFEKKLEGRKFLLISRDEEDSRETVGTALESSVERSNSKQSCVEQVFDNR